jgi:hypothetical protein
MSLYEIIITRAGIPHETWEAEAQSETEAIAGCRVIRVTEGDHDVADHYTAVARCEMSDDTALAFAFSDAAQHMPELYLLGMEAVAC